MHKEWFHGANQLVLNQHHHVALLGYSHLRTTPVTDSRIQRKMMKVIFMLMCFMSVLDINEILSYFLFPSIFSYFVIIICCSHLLEFHFTHNVQYMEVKYLSCQVAHQCMARRQRNRDKQMKYDDLNVSLPKQGNKSWASQVNCQRMWVTNIFFILTILTVTLCANWEYKMKIFVMFHYNTRSKKKILIINVNLCG